MGRRSQEDLYFERIGSDFDAFMSQYDVNQRQKLIFEKLLLPGSRLDNALEVGCGTGKISEVLVKQVNHLTVTDISGLLAKRVGERLGCSFQKESAISLSFPDNSFDLVVSSECVEHTPDPLKALGEMSRVLRFGGQLIVTTPNKLWYPLLWISQKTKIRKFEGPEIWIWPLRLRSFLNSLGLQIIKFGGCHLLPWQIPGIKRGLPLVDRWDKYLYPFMINFGFSAVKKGQR
jgi:SAM-dependent methyltransferase